MSDGVLFVIAGGDEGANWPVGVFGTRQAAQDAIDEWDANENPKNWMAYRIYPLELDKVYPLKDGFHQGTPDRE